MVVIVVEVRIVVVVIVVKVVAFSNMTFEWISPNIG